MKRLIWATLWRVIVASIIWGVNGVFTGIFGALGFLGSLAVIPTTVSGCVTGLLAVSYVLTVRRIAGAGTNRNRSPELLTRNAVMLELKNYTANTPFAPIEQRLSKQSERFAARKTELLKLLRGRFGTGITHDKFAGAVTGVEVLLTENSRHILSCFRSFDSSEFAYAKARLSELDRKSMTETLKNAARGVVTDFVTELGQSFGGGGNRGNSGNGGNAVIVDAETDEHRALREKRDIMQGYVDEAERGISDNEKIILQLDKLFLEISKLDDTNDVEHSAAMEELDCLIENTKLYRD